MTKTKRSSDKNHAKKKTIKYALYGMKIVSKQLFNNTTLKTLNSGSVRVSSNAELIKLLSDKYGITELGGLHYDGRCGIYTIYKTKTDKEGRYLTLHIWKQ